MPRDENVTGGGPTVEWDTGSVDLVYTDGDGEERIRWPMTTRNARMLGEGLLEAAALAGAPDDGEPQQPAEGGERPPIDPCAFEGSDGGPLPAGESAT